MTKNRDVIFSLCEIKRRAAILLGERGNLLRLSGAFLFSLAMVGTAMHIFESICYFIFSEMFPYYVLWIETVIVLSIALPLCMGLLRMAYRMCSLERTHISDLFYYFEKNKMIGAYRVSILVFVAVMVQFALSFALGWLVAYAMSGFGSKMIPDETFILTLIFFLPISGMLPWVCILPTRFFETGDARDAIAYSRKCNFLPPKEIIRFNLSFVPLILLSVLSFGILFVVYTVPLYLVSLQLFVLEKANKKENL